MHCVLLCLVTVTVCTVLLLLSVVVYVYLLQPSASEAVLSVVDMFGFERHEVSVEQHKACSVFNNQYTQYDHQNHMCRVCLNRGPGSVLFHSSRFLSDLNLSLASLKYLCKINILYWSPCFCNPGHFQFSECSFSILHVDTFALKLSGTWRPSVLIHTRPLL